MPLIGRRCNLNLRNKRVLYMTIIASRQLCCMEQQFVAMPQKPTEKGTGWPEQNRKNNRRCSMVCNKVLHTQRSGNSHDQRCVADQTYQGLFQCGRSLHELVREAVNSNTEGNRPYKRGCHAIVKLEQD